MQDLVDMMENLTTRLWGILQQSTDGGRQLVELAEYLWPSDLEQEALYIALDDAVTTATGELYHRFSLRHREFPYCAVGTRSMNVSLPPGPPLVCKFDKFLNAPTCCVGPCVGLREYARNGETGPPTAAMSSRLAAGISLWDASAPEAASLAVELRHAKQRADNITDRRPKTFARQCAFAIRRSVQDLWDLRGGRDLCKAPLIVQQAFSHAQQAHVVYPRPNQPGNGLWLYINDRKREQDFAKSDARSRHQHCRFCVFG